MRIRTYLRVLRGEKSITDVCRLTGLARGEISVYERGSSIPRADKIERMIPVYGPVEGWYPKGVLAVLQPDLPECPGCGDELDPDASRRRRYHDESCRAAARRGGPSHEPPSHQPAMLSGLEREGPPEGGPADPMEGSITSLEGGQMMDGSMQDSADGLAA